MESQAPFVPQLQGRSLIAGAIRTASVNNLKSTAYQVAKYLEFHN
jgi:hypothetical protein